MKLTRAEKETVIRISEADMSWYIYTASKPIMNKLEKFVQPIEVRKDKDGIYAKCYELPKEYVRFVRPRKLSESEKARRTRLLTIDRNSKNGIQKSRGHVKNEIKIAR